MGSATADILFLPSNFVFNRALNSCCGKLRKSAAMRTSGSMPASSLPSLPSARANIASMARFSCSIFFASILFASTFFASIFLRSLLPEFRERLGIGTLHARPQAGDGAKLQLLHRALGLADLPRHFFDAFLL